MNLTFIIEGGTATERHILEHLFLMRTKNFPESRSLEMYIRNKVDNKNFDSFHSYLDYTECTFLSIPTEISELILEEYKTWYFTEEDFDFEKRIIEIEYSHINKKVLKKEKKIIEDNQEITDINQIINMTFEKLKYLKNNVFKISMLNNLNNKKVFSHKEDFLVLSKRKINFLKNNYTCFELESNDLIFDISQILDCILYNKYKESLRCVQYISIDKSLIILDCMRGFGFVKYTLIKNAIEEWFDLVIDLYIEDSKKYTRDTVRKSMTNSVNICNYMSKDEVKKEVFKFIYTLEKYEKQN